MSREIFQKMVTLEEQLSWAVQPTEPVLPPYGELTKVTGVIERIHIEKQKSFFQPENYRTAEYEVERNVILNRIASVLSFLSGQLAMLANAGKGKGPKVETTGYFINVQVNGIAYRGWAGACPFQPGDEVELAVEWQDDHYELYAIARPKDKMISVCPTCFRGKIADIKKSIKEFFIGVATFDIFMLAITVLFRDLDYFVSKMFIPLLGMNLFFLVILFVGTLINSNTFFQTNVKLSEQIFKTFGLKDPQKINLQKITKKRLKQLYKDTGIKLTKADYEKQPMQYKFWSSLTDCYLYYYE